MMLPKAPRVPRSPILALPAINSRALLALIPRALTRRISSSLVLAHVGVSMVMHVAFAIAVSLAPF